MEPKVKIAYVIAAHKNPKQFSRLVKRLHCDHATFFIHIDKRAPLHVYKESVNSIDPEKIIFLKQFKASWSEYGIIKAELLALETIVQSGKTFDFIVLLSGQDYPIKSNDFIHAFFQNHKEKTFIEHFPMPFAPWPNGGMDRVNRYHFKLAGKSFAYPAYKNPKNKIEKILNWSFGKYFNKRALPLGMKPYGGEHWWNFNMVTAKYILQFLKDHPEYYHFHKYSFCADEMFFQTLLLNCKNSAISENIINDDLRYYDWSEGNDSPKTFTINDLDTLLLSGKLFARKFDIDLDERVLDELDKVL